MGKEKNSNQLEQQRLENSIQALQQQAAINGVSDKRIQHYRERLAELRIPPPITFAQFKQGFSRSIEKIVNSLPD